MTTTLRIVQPHEFVLDVRTRREAANAAVRQCGERAANISLKETRLGIFARKPCFEKPRVEAVTCAGRIDGSHVRRFRERRRSPVAERRTLAPQLQSHTFDSRVTETLKNLG